MYNKKLNLSKISILKKESGIEQYINQNKSDSNIHLQNSQTKEYDHKKIYRVIDEVKEIVVSNLFIIKQMNNSNDLNQSQKNENVSQIYHSFTKSEEILNEVLNEIFQYQIYTDSILLDQINQLHAMIVNAKNKIQSLSLTKIDLFQKTIKDMIHFVDKIYKELNSYVINTRNFIAVNIAQETLQSSKKTQLHSNKNFSKVFETKNLKSTKPKLFIIKPV